MTHYTFK